MLDQNSPHVLALRLAASAASAAAVAVGIWVAAVDPQDVILTATGISAVFGLWWKVWQDDRSTKHSTKVLEQRLAELTKERDFWREQFMAQNGGTINPDADA